MINRARSAYHREVDIAVKRKLGVIGGKRKLFNRNSVGAVRVVALVLADVYLDVFLNWIAGRGFPSAARNADHRTSAANRLNLSSVDLNNALVRRSPGKSLEIRVVNRLCGILVEEELGEVGSIIFIKVQLASVKLKVGILNVIKGNVAEVSVHRVVVYVNHKTLGILGFCNNINIIGNLYRYLGSLSYALLINRYSRGA